MLNETNGAATAAAARNASGNGGATAMHLLASGPLFGNLGSAGAAVPSTPPTLPPFATPPTSGADHLAQNQATAAAAAAAAMAPHHQMLAALAAVAASRNAAAAMSQQQPHHPAALQHQQHAEALQALLAHAAATSNGMPPFGMYQPPGMRPGMVGPMPPNFMFDGVGAAAGYHPYAMENGRRKNATREVTQPLKVWLEQHHKNPYPTKAEKTVLAIITKMNLTQVSTWFANARRRLKKDNKMTWSPRNNRNADDEDDEDVGSERPSGSPLSTLSDSDARKDSFENSSESGNPNCTNASHCSDAFLFGTNKHLPQQQNQQQQQMDGQKKIWSIEGTLSAPQQSPVKLPPSACSSADILKMDSKVDLSSSSDSSARALAAMTAAFMAQQRAAAAAAAAAKTSPPAADDAGHEDLKAPAGLPFGMNPVAMAALNSLAQQQQNANQQQQQQMLMNPLFAFLSQNQRQLQSHQQQQQQQQQNILFMVAAAAAAAAAKNPQQQQQNLFNLQQQQQQQMQRHGGLESSEGRGSECEANSASASPASCSADAISSPAPNLLAVCDANGICEPFEERSQTSSAELAPSPSVSRPPTCPDDVDSETPCGQHETEGDEDNA